MIRPDGVRAFRGILYGLAGGFVVWAVMVAAYVEAVTR